MPFSVKGNTIRAAVYLHGAVFENGTIRQFLFRALPGVPCVCFRCVVMAYAGFHRRDGRRILGTVQYIRIRIGNKAVFFPGDPRIFQWIREPCQLCDRQRDIVPVTAILHSNTSLCYNDIIIPEKRQIVKPVRDTKRKRRIPLTNGQDACIIW